MKKSTILLGMCLLSSIYLTSCSSTDNDDNKSIPVTSITLNHTSLSLIEEGTYILVATILPSNASDKTISWSSDNMSVASVENGVVTAVGVGETVITATAGFKSARCAISINAKVVNVESISLKKEKIALLKGMSETLIATISPSNATNKSVKWQSSNPDVATIDDAGTVTAISEGKAIITAATVNSNITAKSSVTVEKNRIYAIGCANSFGSLYVFTNGERIKGELGSLLLASKVRVDGRNYYSCLSYQSNTGLYQSEKNKTYFSSDLTAITDMTIANGVVYYCGGNMNDGSYTNVYKRKNDELKTYRINATLNTAIRAKAIEVAKNGDIYVAGCEVDNNYNYVAKVWTVSAANGSITVKDLCKEYLANVDDITITENRDVYVIVSYAADRNERFTQTLALYKNGVFVQNISNKIHTGNDACLIKAYNNDIYIVASEQNNNKNVLKIWRNGEFMYALNNDNSYGSADDMDIDSKGNIYVSGSVHDITGYKAHIWKNNAILYDESSFSTYLSVAIME